MRKVYQKLLLLLISSALCIFYLHIKWTKDRWFFTEYQGPGASTSVQPPNPAGVTMRATVQTEVAAENQAASAGIPLGVLSDPESQQGAMETSSVPGPSGAAGSGQQSAAGAGNGRSGLRFLAEASLAPSTWKAYRAAWKRWEVFLLSGPDGSSGDPNVSPQNSVTYEHRRAIVELYCEKNNLINSSVSLDQRVAAQLYVEHSHKFIYCEVPKVGCSNWKRIILLLNDSLGRSLTELKHYAVHTSSLLIKLRSYPPSIQTQLLANYTKVMFTRDPLERVVSAYRDKFLHEDDIYYSRNIANRIKRTVRKNENSTENITFEEFVRYIVQEDRRYRDTHWRPMYHLCDPCNIHYDIIGKFETIKQDADFVLKTIGAPKDLSYPNMKHHSNDTRTNDQISKHYLESLSSSLFGQLVNVYSVDFSMFEYSHYNNTKSFENKLDV
ncbi:carbohydrate sulfotransferase 9-like isoform X2 [Mixophyes fleayi]|uniref:carbohydrate sulfotransferase 9-like isoform X2 n=1 Tax=Mixophyes fleayi TaxID=3061075 RepID=UPI003F4D98E8